MDEKFQVSDPTDWQETSIPLLSSLDASLRCQVCKDFFEAAVITNCAHTFCSKCIRRAISADGKCPACRTGISEHQLRRNVAVQEVVQAFEAARSQALEVARRKVETQMEMSSRETRGSKRKREDLQDQSSSQQPPRTRGQVKRSRQDGPVEDAVTIDLDGDDGDDVKDQNYTPDVEPEQINDGLVSCPICNRRMKEDVVYSHLDTCEGPGRSTGTKNRPSRNDTPLQNATSNSSSPKPPPERLPQLNYVLMKEIDLRRKLSELGIPTGGSKEVLSRRHKEWVNIWNSNCDSLRPRTKKELLKDLDHWERTHGGSIGTASQQTNGVMSKDFDGAGWARQNKSDFDALIANARKGRQKALATRVEGEEARQTTGSESDSMTPVPRSVKMDRASTEGSKEGPNTVNLDPSRNSAIEESEQNPVDSSRLSSGYTPAASIETSHHLPAVSSVNSNPHLPIAKSVEPHHSTVAHLHTRHTSHPQPMGPPSGTTPTTTAAPAPDLSQISLSPETHRRRKSMSSSSSSQHHNSDRVPYRRSKGASPVAGFTVLASLGQVSPLIQPIVRRDSSSTGSATPVSQAGEATTPVQDSGSPSNSNSRAVSRHNSLSGPTNTSTSKIIPTLKHSGSSISSTASNLSEATSLHESLAEGFSGGLGMGMGRRASMTSTGVIKTMPMFEMPSEPIDEVEVGK